MLKEAKAVRILIKPTDINNYNEASLDMKRKIMFRLFAKKVLSRKEIPFRAVYEKSQVLNNKWKNVVLYEKRDSNRPGELEIEPKFESKFIPSIKKNINVEIPNGVIYVVHFVTTRGHRAKYGVEHPLDHELIEYFNSAVDAATYIKRFDPDAKEKIFNDGLKIKITPTTVTELLVGDKFRTDGMCDPESIMTILSFFMSVKQGDDLNECQ